MPLSLTANDLTTLSASTTSISEVLTNLSTDQSGLSTDEATHRLEIFGENRLSVKKKISPFMLYLGQFKNTLTIILLVAALLILFIYLLGDKDPSDLIEAGLIFSIVILITLVGFIQEFKAEKAIESLKKLMSFKTRAFRNGSETEIDVKLLVPGDIVLLEEGTQIPADIRLISTSSLTVNEASLTGESNPVRKSTEVLNSKSSIADQLNMVFCGTSVASGRGLGVVIKTGDLTEIGKIAVAVADTEDEKTPIQKRLDEIGKLIGYIIIGVCVVVFIFILFFAKEISNQPIIERVIHAFIAAVALAVAAIPEGLPAVVTISLALGTQRMLKRNVLVRKLSAIETLGATDVICSDKTGTLTKGEMTVTRIYQNGKVYFVSGTGYDTKGDFTSDGIEVIKSDLKQLLATGEYCNNAKLTDNGTILGDTTEAALLVSAKKAEIELSGKRILEIPFSSERKMMTVVVKENEKYIVYSKGAPEILLKSCNHVFENNQKAILNSERINQIHKVNQDFAQSALRSLGFAYKYISESEFNSAKNDESFFEKDLVFLGLQGMIDPPRVEVKPLIVQCHESGIRVIMITGDHIDTAKAVAKEIGIQGEALTGDELSNMSQVDFEKIVDKISIYARVNPSFKMRIIEALKKAGHIVAMTGDGVNDAPALKKADIGIAMGITGTDVAKEASDMVLLDDHFSTIIAAIEEGRGIFHNIRKFVLYLLTCNLAEVIIIFITVIFFQELALTATMLLWINVVTDGLPAIALGLDPAEKGIMKYNPQIFQKEVITKALWVKMIIFAILLAVVILGIFLPNLKNGLLTAQSAAFSALVCIELVYVYMIRSMYKISLFSNKWLLLAIISTLLLQIFLISLPFTKSLFGVIDIATSDWGYIFISCIVLWISFISVQKLSILIKGKTATSVVIN